MTIFRTFSFLFIALLLFGCSQQEEQAHNQQASVVKTFEVSAPDTSIRREFIGEVVAKSTVELSFQVPGRLQEFAVPQGDIVPAGTLIAALDDTDYRLAVRNARADLRLAEADVERKRMLVSLGAVSGIERDVAEANYDQAQVQLEHAELELERTRLYAPYAAMITRRLVDPQTMVAPEVPVVIIQDMSELRVRTQVPETFFERLMQDFAANPQQDARMTGQFEASLLTSPHTRYPLEYREHISQAAPTTQTYEVEFAFSQLHDQQASLIALPGMVANVRIEVPNPTQNNRIRVPVNALKTAPQGRFYVFALNDAADRVRQIEVDVETLSASHAYITNGLEGGETIVAAGASRLNDGDAVKPMQEAL